MSNRSTPERKDDSSGIFAPTDEAVFIALRMCLEKAQGFESTVLIVSKIPVPGSQPLSSHTV
jgi:hypothetical protein